MECTHTKSLQIGVEPFGAHAPEVPTAERKGDVNAAFSDQTPRTIERMKLTPRSCWTFLQWGSATERVTAGAACTTGLAVDVAEGLRRAVGLQYDLLWMVPGL